MRPDTAKALDGLKIVATALSGAAGLAKKAAKKAAKFAREKLKKKVARKYAARVRARGVQDPRSHNFPYSFDDEILATTPIPKANGYNIYQKAGTMNDKTGVFEIGVRSNGVIDHRFFRPYK